MSRKGTRVDYPTDSRLTTKVTKVSKITKKTITRRNGATEVNGRSSQNSPRCKGRQGAAGGPRFTRPGSRATENHKPPESFCDLRPFAIFAMFFSQRPLPA